MPVDKLLKALPVLFSQITVLLEFEVAQKDLNNSIISCAFLLLYKDLIRLFASYNEGMINLIEQYFTLKRSQCRVGLELYHGFPEVQAKITDFLTLAESMGIGDRDSLWSSTSKSSMCPCLLIVDVPPKVIQAMEQHLAILESKKGNSVVAMLVIQCVFTFPAARMTMMRALLKVCLLYTSRPRKPALPVPIPATVPASPQKPPIPRSPERAVLPKKLLTEPDDQSQSQHDTPRGAGKGEVGLDQVDDEPMEASASCPTVVVNDEVILCACSLFSFQVPPKVIQAMEQHLAILESKKGSDDDDESTTESLSLIHIAPKKPALPVPIPATVPASPQKPPIPRSPERAVLPKKLLTEPDDQSQSQHDTPRGAGKGEVGLDQVDDEPMEASASCPTVVVNDEDGLPSALQEEIIATATSHFTDSIVKSNEAVKRSAQQTAVVCPVIHTQLGRSEQRTVPIRPSASAARSQSPSPSRAPSHSPHSEPTVNQMNSASDGELEEINQHAVKGNIDTKRNLSLLGLNEKPHHGSASPICGSPFAADEKDVEPASGPPAWPEVPDDADQSDFNTSFNASTPAPSATIPAVRQTTHHSALDDLLGLDLMSADMDEATGIMPTPAAAAIPQSSDKVDNLGQKPSGFGLDDLLALDPLLHGDEIAPAVTAVATTPSTGSVLPAGLKQVNPTVPIRPAVSSTTPNKNPLDALDTTLVNLASSLGGQQGWGSSNPKKRPLKDQTKTGVSSARRLLLPTCTIVLVPTSYVVAVLNVDTKLKLHVAVNVNIGCSVGGKTVNVIYMMPIFLRVFPLLSCSSSTTLPDCSWMCFLERLLMDSLLLPRHNSHNPPFALCAYSANKPLRRTVELRIFGSL
ncbi:hypothetical protein AHF37_04939 [Paragonimus kellicotti]|nr:hypothetical protein AHF37_04939 [Paragonimus kellicotti]